MACLVLGMSVAGVDANYTVDQRNEVLRSVRINALLVQDEALASSIPRDVRQRLSLFATLRIGSEESSSRTTSLESLLCGLESSRWVDALVAAEPDDEALVVFSSGTTGQPKPVAYSHRQVLVAVEAILDAYPDIAEGSHLLCWLPLANLFQRIVDFCGIERGATSYIISDPREVMRYLPRANPHVLIGVPRFYEKLHAGIHDRISTASRPASALAHWALKAGSKRPPATRRPSMRSTLDRGADKVADRLVFRRLRRTFGSNLRYLISGSAPMPLWLLDWFERIGLPVFEAYGVTENVVPIAMNRPGARRLATVGKPLPSQDVRLAEDNEIVVRGTGVFDGYLTATGAKTSGPDPQGFWATGDYGEFDADGFLRVLGRKSDVFKSPNGRWIAPARIEALLRRFPYVEHAMVVGAGRRFLVALVAVELAKIAQRPTRRHNARNTTLSAQEAAAVVQRDIATATAVLAPYERPAGIIITSHRFSIEGGELTSNLKLRRSVVERAFADRIEVLLAALAAQAEVPHHLDANGDTPLLVQWA